MCDRSILGSFCIDFVRTLHFHGAPPCGTSSPARDRPLSTESHGPQPLRSCGFPWLTNLGKQRVLSANQIYIQMAAFCKWLCQNIRKIHTCGRFPSSSNWHTFHCASAFIRVVMEAFVRSYQVSRRVWLSFEDGRPFATVAMSTRPGV